MPKLTWPRATRFHDRGHGDLPRLDVTGPATVEVPDDAVEHLKSRGWVDPSEEDDDTDADGTEAEGAATAVVEPTDDTEEEPDTDAAEDDDTAAEDAEGAEEDTDDTDAEEAAESEEFDPEAFTDRKWHVVAEDVKDGAADDHLEAVREAEEARPNGPRGSVETALDDRQEALEAE